MKLKAGLDTIYTMRRANGLALFYHYLSTYGVCMMLCVYVYQYVHIYGYHLAAKVTFPAN